MVNAKKKTRPYGGMLHDRMVDGRCRREDEIDFLSRPLSTWEIRLWSILHPI